MRHWVQDIPLPIIHRKMDLKFYIGEKFNIIKKVVGTLKKAPWLTATKKHKIKASLEDYYMAPCFVPTAGPQLWVPIPTHTLVQGAAKKLTWSLKKDFVLVETPPLAICRYMAATANC